MPLVKAVFQGVRTLWTRESSSPPPFPGTVCQALCQEPKSQATGVKPSRVHLPGVCSLYGGTDIRLFQNVRDRDIECLGWIPSIIITTADVVGWVLCARHRSGPFDVCTAACGIIIRCTPSTQIGDWDIVCSGETPMGGRFWRWKESQPWEARGRIFWIEGPQSSRALRL